MIIDHVNLVVQDLDLMTSFYRDVLGFQETKRARLCGDWIDRVVGLDGVQAEVVYLVPSGGEPRIELLKYETPLAEALPPGSANTPGIRHIAFRINNMDNMIERLKVAGIAPFSAPVEVPGSCVKHSEGRKRLCYFRDPEGTILELAEYV